MDKNTQHLVLSEMHSAAGYLERLTYALNEVQRQTQMPQLIELQQGAKKSLQVFIEREVLQSSFQISPGHALQLDLEEVIELSKNMIEAILKFQVDAHSTIELSVNYINLLYSLALPIHKMVNHYGNMEVQYPRTALIEMDMLETDTEEESIPKFELKIESLVDTQNNQISTITSLQWQRNKKTKEFIKKGHEAVFKSEYEKALDYFTKALNYIESAEVLTLVAWSYSLLADTEKAKSYCLRAIQKDPNYGPPYNDMGTYLLDENQLNESLQWFELAKKCSNYQNREYPYINSGRAYMAKHDYQKALDEFSKALALAPFHEELHNTIKKIKETINKKKKYKDLENELPPML